MQDLLELNAAAVAVGNGVVYAESFTAAPSTVHNEPRVLVVCPGAQ